MSTGQNPDYYPLTSIQEQLVDKLTDKPLASGVVYFFEDNARTIPKEVFTLDNNPQDYTYSSLGTSLTLSSIGTFNDSLGNNIIPYLYPFDAQGNKQLYYITVYNSGGVFQFSLGNLPFMGAVNVAPNPPPASDNYITNGQFAIGQNAQTITATSTPIAYGGWQFIKSSNLCATDTVAFPRFNAPLNGIPSGNPRYACRISTTTPNAGDSFKTLQIVFQDVNRFSDPNQQLTLFFSGLNNQTGLLQLNVDLYKNFGVGGSTPTTTPIGSMAFSNTGYNDAVLPFFFESNYGKTLGSGNDDYFAIQIQLPPTLAFDISVTDFALFLGNIDVEKYPFTTNPTGPYINVQKFTTSGTYTPSNGMSYCAIECWGGGGATNSRIGSIAGNFGGGGGGAGGYSRLTASKYTIGTSQAVTIGSGGVTGPTATAGGTTSVGTICVANGGNSSNNSIAGYGAISGTGDIAAPGMNGEQGSFTTDINGFSYGGSGGSTMVGGGGIGGFSSGGVNNGSPGVGYGSGAGGCAADNTTDTAYGANGAPGYVIITEIMN